MIRVLDSDISTLLLLILSYRKKCYSINLDKRIEGEARIMEKEDIRIKRGYLNNDYEIYHLKDKRNQEFEFHYHDFNKIVVFLSGKVTYHIEGKAYKLKPWDILLISSSEIHRPAIDPEETYERIILWVNSSFLNKHKVEDNDLQDCFKLDSQKRVNLIRLNPKQLGLIKQLLLQLEAERHSREFGSRVLGNALFIQLMVHLNRLYNCSENESPAEDIEYDESIGTVIEHINKNLNGDLSVDSLASLIFMSRYHLMHKFKSQTGYTLHNYILQKRLIWANNLIKSGMQITDACLECGFGDYSNFARAYKKAFGMSPREYCKIAEQDRPIHLLNE